ncbi:MAG: class I SAM-dependent methyltransferase, partial [Chloroflexota bacterium]|nr:class I SAM-dependent methyltransferase [Chloroflexota bacterium]
SDLRATVLDCDYGLGLVRRGRSEELLPYSEEDIDQMTYADLDANRETLLGLREPNFFFNFLDELASVVC